MRAIIQRFSSPDEDLQTFNPPDPSNVGLLVEIIAAPEGSNGEESFGVVVCTPKWLAGEIESNGPVTGRHYFFVSRWDRDQVLSCLSALVSDLEAPTWVELAEKIGRLGKWEFEDYVEFVEE